MTADELVRVRGELELQTVHGIYVPTRDIADIHVYIQSIKSHQHFRDWVESVAIKIIGTAREINGKRVFAFPVRRFETQQATIHTGFGTCYGLPLQNVVQTVTRKLQKEFKEIPRRESDEVRLVSTLFGSSEGVDLVYSARLCQDVMRGELSLDQKVKTIAESGYDTPEFSGEIKDRKVRIRTPPLDHKILRMLSHTQAPSSFPLLAVVYRSDYFVIDSQDSNPYQSTVWTFDGDPQDALVAICRFEDEKSP